MEVYVSPFIMIDTGSDSFDGAERLVAWLYTPPLPDQRDNDPVSIKVLESEFETEDMGEEEYDGFVEQANRLAVRLGYIPVEVQFTWKEWAKGYENRCASNR